MKYSIEVFINKQILIVKKKNQVVQQWSVSTAKNGTGEQLGSECTPRGRHIIRAKIGANCPLNTVFIRRRPSGEIFSEALRQQYPDRDWILTRILWLSGCEVGKNRLHQCDTMRRYIYIHGCPDNDPMGIPSSHGCIKMRNQDIVHLFDLICAGTPVDIHE